MCTSAPDMDRTHHYFADYEAYDGGLPFAWGQVTLSCTTDTATLSPDEVVARMRQRAAEQQGIDASAIRLRNLCRL